MGGASQEKVLHFMRHGTAQLCMTGLVNEKVTLSSMGQSDVGRMRTWRLHHRQHDILTGSS